MSKRTPTLSIPAISRATIDGWLVSDAGLPPRVVNACRRQGIKTIASLRKQPSDTLLQMRSFGNRSLTDVADFFKFCDRLERGRVRFDSAEALLIHFLDPTAIEILTERYALQDSESIVASGATLDAIGRQFGLTRERVRQQVVAIHNELKTQLAQTCLAPLLEWYDHFLRKRDGVASGTDLDAVPFRRWLGNYNPCRLLQLLTELQSSIVLHGSLFSLLPVTVLEQIEKTAVRYLLRHPKPQRLSDVISEFEEQGWFSKQRGYSPQLVVQVMENSTMIGATLDGHFFLFPEGMIYLLATLVSEFPGSVRLKALAERYNEEVKPPSRRSENYIMDLLTRSPIFVRGRDGTYRLRK